MTIKMDDGQKLIGRKKTELHRQLATPMWNPRTRDNICYRVREFDAQAYVGTVDTFWNIGDMASLPM